jgi:muramoyltetrapeptide carboxypeptidase LdcA involved in peptidoglycan recycling
MIYPSYIQKGGCIGIAAPSAGVGDKLPDFEQSLAVLKNQGYTIRETASVRTADQRSADPVIRGKEMTSLFTDDDVDMVIAAAGGDFLDEMIPYFDFAEAARHPKWMMGASDPTGLLYPYTVKYDVASFYGMNAGSFDLGSDWDYIANALAFLSGQKTEETNFPTYMSKAKFMVDTPAYDTPVEWHSTVSHLHVRGRCIGGCIDGLKDLIGTRFDATRDFVEHYKDDRQIFYFDNFALSAENLYRTLIQFRYAGWFDHTEAVIIGRTLFESSETGMSYDEAARQALPDIPVITNADIGHTIPCMVMINGAMLDLTYDEGHAGLSFTLI